MVCITNNAVFLERSTQVGSSMVRVMVLSMCPYIEYYFDLMSTASVSSCTSGSNLCWYSSYWSRFLWGSWGFISSREFYLKR